MGRTARIWRLLAVVAGVLCAQRTAGGPAAAADAEGAASVTVRMMPLPGAQPGRAGASGEIRAGTTVSICMTASAPGYVTLWSTDASNRVVRIYPNDFALAGELGAPIKAGEPLCVGQDATFGLAIAGPAGRSRVSVHWTRRKEENWPADAFQSLGRGFADEANAQLDYLVTS